MDGFDALFDTNVIINALKNNNQPLIESLTKHEVHISIITKIELLGYSRITDTERDLLSMLLKDFYIIPLTSKIANLAIELRKKYHLKTPDSIICASALKYSIPLITGDKQLLKVTEIDIVNTNLKKK